MVSVCMYFQVHQPFRLCKYRIFDISHTHDYFDEHTNSTILRKVAQKCYIPANELMLRLIRKHPQFRLAYSFSGTVLEQLEKYAPETLSSFQQLVNTGRVELLGETYYHSLASLFSEKEFTRQVALHRKKIGELFNTRSVIFRNTELIASNRIAQLAYDMGFKGILTEGWDPILAGRSPNFTYHMKGSSLPVLLKNYHLSDDVAFRFSSREWKEHPLTSDKYARWISAANGNGNIINLFMDYETLGEHQWAETGIFPFMESLPEELLKHPHNDFVTPSEAIARYPPQDELDIPCPISWADTERDLSAWTGNKMQQAALRKLYELELPVFASGNRSIINDWRKLQTSDHFYYMCTKWFNDGDVHKYFNPYDNPYECFISFMNIINDFKKRLGEKCTNESVENDIHEKEKAGETHETQDETSAQVLM